MSFLALVPTVSFAATKVGFADIPFVLDNAPQAKSASQRLEKKFGQRQSALKNKLEKLQSLRTNLEKESLVMSEKERGKAEEKIRGLEREYRREEREFREDLSVQKNNEFKKVREIVVKAINKFAKKQKYDLILSDGVLYAAESIDVTKQILKELEK